MMDMSAMGPKELKEQCPFGLPMHPLNCGKLNCTKPNRCPMIMLCICP